MYDVAVIGAGAAGLMAAIWAGRTNPKRKIVVLENALKLGAKILVSGGGRCNVTHDEVDVSAFSGSTPNAIRKVLRRFDVPQTVEFFSQLGVKLKREETGKLFPVTDSARSVLDALLAATADAGVEILHPWRVESVLREGDAFEVRGSVGAMYARKIVLATGGKSLPKTGSDGHGYTIAKSFGHQITQHVFPALVPLTLPAEHFLCRLSGASAEARLEVLSENGRKIESIGGAVLCTHFGVSGPAVLDVSRFLIEARISDPHAMLVADWWPAKTGSEIDGELRSLGAATILKFLRSCLPERLARSLCEQAGIDPVATGSRLTRESRKTLVRTIKRMILPVTGNRGFNFAEATAGGVPLSQLHLNTMESRLCSGLFLCGEICDVDGRIGGYNFQWAWASGYVAGVSCV